MDSLQRRVLAGLMCNIVSFFLLLFFLSPIHPAQEVMELQGTHSRAIFLSESEELVPGSVVKLGLWIGLDEGWHTYWRNAGDSGAPPIINWTLPEGYRVSKLRYPLPRRFINGKLHTIGYEGEVLLWVELFVPVEEKEFVGAVREITINAEWLVCKEECIPAFFTKTLSLPVVESPLKKPSPRLFQEITSFENRRGSLTVEKKELVLTLPLGDPSLEVVDLFAYPDLPVKTIKPVFEIRNGILEARIQRLVPEKFEPGSGMFLAVVNSPQSEEKRGILFQAVEDDSSLAWMLLLAFLGGLLLNFMPCVFPILALKFYGVFKLGREAKREILRAQVFYQAGILVSFWILAAALMILRSAGSSAGWGFHLQSPLFVSLLILFFFLMGLSFLDFLSIRSLSLPKGEELMNREGFTGHFFTGVLAVVVASPCTAPLMGAAIGYALSQTAWLTLLLFSFLGLGLGFPYLLLGMFPAMVRLLPPSGMWMVRFKELMAFPLFGTCVWLFYVLSAQVGHLGMAVVLACVVLSGFGVWIQRSLTGWTRNILIILILSLIGSLLFFQVHRPQQPTPTISAATIWKPFSSKILHQYLGEGKSVFVNFTAAWCITCQANELYTFSSQRVRGYLKESDLIMLKADWTNRDEEIGRILQSFGRAGVPMYLFYPKGSKKALLLPELLTPEIFLKTVQQKD